MGLRGEIRYITLQNITSYSGTYLRELVEAQLKYVLGRGVHF